MTAAALAVTTPQYQWYALLLVMLVALDGRPEWLAFAAGAYYAAEPGLGRYTLPDRVHDAVAYGVPVLVVSGGLAHPARAGPARWRRHRPGCGGRGGCPWYAGRGGRGRRGAADGGGPGCGTIAAAGGACRSRGPGLSGAGPGPALPYRLVTREPNTKRTGPSGP